MLVALSISVASFAGAGTSVTYFYPYETFSNRAQYTGVEAGRQAAALNDAGGITYKVGVHPNLAMVTGLRASGEIYCVVPIVDKLLLADPSKNEVQFWAVGKNCCRFRSQFNCGPVERVSGKSGAAIVLQDFSSELPDIIPKWPDQMFYRQAIRVAQDIYPIKTNSQEAMLVEWVADSQDNSAVWWEGFYVIGNLTFYYALAAFPVCWVMARRTDPKFAAHQG